VTRQIDLPVAALAEQADSAADAVVVGRRPVMVISAATYNNSRLATVVAVTITSNTYLATMPGNVFLPAAVTGLPKDSVVNVTAVVTLNKTELSEQAGLVPLALLREIDRGLRHVLDL
jgi:mRNA interferase MazF